MRMDYRNSLTSNGITADMSTIDKVALDIHVSKITNIYLNDQILH